MMGTALQRTSCCIAMLLVSFVPALNAQGPDVLTAPDTTKFQQSTVAKTTNTHVNRIKRQPNNWPYDVETNQLPAGLQSPINIVMSHLKPLDLPPLEYHIFEQMDATDFVKCENDGKSLACSLTTKTRVPYVSGGPLPGRYLFANTHWHWGKTDKSGSEHNINNKTFPVELHAVFWRENYGDFKTAAIHQDGLCVLAWIGELSEKDNADFKSLFDDAVTLVPYGSKTIRPWTAVMTFLNKLIKDKDGNPNQNWVTYPGALTAPPYWESVAWIIYRDPFPISSRQVSLFRNLETKDGTKNLEHTMPIVPLNGRNIYMRAPIKNAAINRIRKAAVSKRSLLPNEILTLPARQLPNTTEDPMNYYKGFVENGTPVISKVNDAHGLDLPQNVSSSVTSLVGHERSASQDAHKWQTGSPLPPFLGKITGLVTPPRPRVDTEGMKQNIMATANGAKPPVK